MTKSVLCMNPGPIEFEPRVLDAFAAEGISHVDKRVIEVFGQALEKMRHVFLAPDGQPLIVAGSGTLGWDMVGANLVQQGDNVLVINTGYFGDSFAECLERYGATTTHVRAAAVGHQPTVADVTAALTSGTSFAVVTITHVDTSTGVLAHVEAFAAAVRAHQPNALVVVDSVCALGGEVCRMKQWDLDVVLTGSQKCVGVPAGLSLVMVRPRALQQFEQNAKSTKSTYYYVDWHKWLPIMKNYEVRQPSYFATPAVNHLFALNVAFDVLLEHGGIEQRFIEHQRIATAIQQAITALGCTFVPASNSFAHTLTCVRYPQGVKATDFLPKVVAHGVSLAGGLHKDIKTEYFRIGHMGPSTRRLDHVVKTIDAIEAALLACGHVIQEKGRARKIVLALQDTIPLTPPVGKSQKDAKTKTPSNKTMAFGCPVPLSCQVWTLATLGAAFTAGFVLAHYNKK